MKLLVFSVLDKAVDAFNNPMFFRTKLEAIRSFSDAVQQEGSQFQRHCEDYFLMFLGVYDDAMGSFDCGMPERIISAVECVAVGNRAETVDVTPVDRRARPVS